MNYWQLTESELDEIGSREGDATIFYSLSAFFLAWGLDWGKDIILEDMEPNFRAIWGVAVLFALAVSLSAFLVARRFQKTATSRLTRIKEDHDHG